jgi:hypothetical protein
LDEDHEEAECGGPDFRFETPEVHDEIPTKMIRVDYDDTDEGASSSTCVGMTKSKLSSPKSGVMKNNVCNKNASRMRKTKEQAKVLQDEFERNPDWDQKIRARLSQETGLSKDQIYKWYWDNRKKGNFAKDEFGGYPNKSVTSTRPQAPTNPRDTEFECPDFTEVQSIAQEIGLSDAELFEKAK